MLIKKWMISRDLFARAFDVNRIAVQSPFLSRFLFHWNRTRCEIYIHNKSYSQSSGVSSHIVCSIRARYSVCADAGFVRVYRLCVCIQHILHTTWAGSFCVWFSFSIPIETNATLVFKLVLCVSLEWIHQSDVIVKKCYSRWPNSKQKLTESKFLSFWIW